MRFSAASVMTAPCLIQRCRTRPTLHDGRRYARDQGLSVQRAVGAPRRRPPIHYHFRQQRWAMLFCRRCSIRNAYAPDTFEEPGMEQRRLSRRSAGIAASATTPRNLASRWTTAKNSAARSRGLARLQYQLRQATGVGGWSDDDLASYLSTGHAKARHGSGRWAKRSTTVLSQLAPEDIRAVVAYLRSALRRMPLVPEITICATLVAPDLTAQRRSASPSADKLLAVQPLQLRRHLEPSCSRAWRVGLLCEAVPWTNRGGRSVEAGLALRR